MKAQWLKDGWRPSWKVMVVVVVVLMALVSWWAYAAVQARRSQPVRWAADDSTNTPAIVWPYGQPNMSDPAVRDLYQANIELALAVNQGDFSRPALKVYVADEYLADYAWRDFNGIKSVGPEDGPNILQRSGPVAFVVTEVTRSGDTATVSTCRQSGFLSAYPPFATVESAAHNGHGREVDFVMVADGEGFKLSEYVSYNGGCDYIGLQPGFFDPPITEGLYIAPSEYLGPDGQPMTSE